VLSAVCAGTRYTAAGFMVSKSTADLWDSLQRIWILSLAGCPLNILLDSASEHRSDEMSGLASGCVIELQFSLVESHSSLGSGERVHSLIRNVYHKVHIHAPYLSLETKLAWSVFSLNATPPPDGTAASLLVFVTLPRLPVSGLDQAAPLWNDCRLTVMLIARDEAERQNVLRRLSEIKRHNAPSDKNISYGDLCYVYRDKGVYKDTKAGYTELYTFIGKEGQTGHVLNGSTAKRFPFSMIRPAAAAQMHADEQSKRLCADCITAMVALRSGTAEYAPLRNRLSDRNYRQCNEQDNVQGSTEEDCVQGNTKEGDAQDIDDKNNSPTALNAILPRMARSTTRAAAAASDFGIVHHVFAAKAAKPNDAMDPEVRVNSIIKKVRGLFNRGAFSLVHVDAVPSHANIIGTRIITRLKYFGTIDEEAEARLII
jgi:hypothetical protein